MKRLIAIIALLSFISIQIFAQTAGDYRSRQNGPWSAPSTWEVYDGSNWNQATSAPDKNANLITIRQNHTVKIDEDVTANNLTVDQNGRLESESGMSDTLTVYGDFINNGNVDFYTSSSENVILRFSGDKNSHFTTGSANTKIYQILVAKDTINDTIFLSADQNFLIQGQNSNAPDFLKYTKGGTFVLGGTVSLSSSTFIDGGTYITLTNNQGFWLNNPNYTVLARDQHFEVEGSLHISQGTMNVGSTQNRSLYLQNHCTFIQDGGTLNIAGSFYDAYNDTVNVNISDGTINVAKQPISTYYYYCFRIGCPATNFTMSGGTINIININTKDNGLEYQAVSDDDHTNITGGLVNIGTGDTPDNDTFRILGKMPNVVVDNTNNTKVAEIRGETTVFGDLTIQDGSKLKIQTPTSKNIGRHLYLYGDLIADGNLIGYIENNGYEGRLTLVFKGEQYQQVTGGADTVLVYQITVSKGHNTTPTAEILRTIEVDSADSNDENRLYIESGTLKISAENYWKAYIGSGYEGVTTDTGRLWLNNPQARIAFYSGTGTMWFKGDLFIDSGRIDATGNILLDKTDWSENYINTGSINCAGKMYIKNKFTVNGGTINVDSSLNIEGNETDEHGELTLNNGTINIGNGDDVLTLTGGTGDDGLGAKLIVHNGTINLFGRMYISNGTGTEISHFTMDGGEINIDPQAEVNLPNNQDIVAMGQNSIVNFTGGTMTIVDPQADKDTVYRDALDIKGSSDNKNFAGSTIKLGDGVSSSPGDDKYPGFSIYLASGIRLGTLILDNPSGDNRQFMGRTNCDILVQNLIIKTSHDLYVMNGRALDITGDFTNNGTLDGRVSGSHLKFTGSSLQTYSGSGSVANFLQELTFDNSGSGVKLEADLGAKQVNLSDGIVYSSTAGNGLLTVYGTDSDNLSGGNDTTFVQGYLRRTLSSDASGVTFAYPIGSSSGFYRLDFKNLTTSGSDTGFVTAFVSQPQDPQINGTAGTGVKDPMNMKDIYWKMSFDLHNVTFSQKPKVKLYYDASGLPPFCIAQSNNDINGTYNSIGRLILPDGIESTTFDLNSNNGLVPTGDAYIVITQVQPIEGTLTVGNSGDVLNLTEIADTLAKNFISGYVHFELQDDYDPTTEQIPVIFDTIMKVNLTDAVVIRPASGVSGTHTDLSANGPLIILDSINSIKFDGRPGGSGSGDWLFANKDSNIVFEFRNGAMQDTLAFLTIKSDIHSTNAGIINFAGTNNNTGNKLNVITNCDITGYSDTATIAIYSAGNSTYPNDSNTVENCKIHDFFNAAENTYGIDLAAASNYWTIRSNKFYQSDSRTFNEDQFYVPIYIATGKGHVIDNNIIGYADDAGNGKTTISGAASQFAGIWIAASKGATTYITNNVIDGIDFTTNYDGYSKCGVFSGIYIDRSSNGNLIIGAKNAGNLIGNTSQTGSITIHHESGGRIYAIKDKGYGKNTIAYNTISGITQRGNNDDDIKYFYGIYIKNADKTIANNNIGFGTLDNSIQIGADGVTTNRNYVFGIYSALSYNQTATINNNTVSNITSYSSSTAGYVAGINIYSGQSVIEYNRIFNLKSTNKYSGTDVRPNVAGIYKNTSVLAVIRGNNIYALGNDYSSNRTLRITGISIKTTNSQADTIDANFIHHLYCNTSNSNGKIYGIVINQGNVLSTNNMIDLGLLPDGSSLDNSVVIQGIRDLTADISNFYHNSVYIGVDNVKNGSSSEYTSCYYKEGTNYSTLENNIFVNKRSNSSSSSNSKHYAIYLNDEETITTDYNIYLANGTGGILANIDSNDLNTIRAVKVYTGENLHSGEGDPNFVNENGDTSNCDLHLNSDGYTPAEGMGIPISIVKTDFDGQLRANYSPVDIGADAGNYNFNSSVDIYCPTFEYTPIEPQNCGVTEVTFDVRIQDQGTGVPTSGSYVPKIYYRDKSQDWSSCDSVSGSLQSGDGNDGIWEFKLTGLENNKYYEYYIVAQDQADAINLGYSKFDLNSPVHSDVKTPETYPDEQLAIDMFTVCVYPKSTYYVGNFDDCPSCDFATLTDYDDFFYNMDAMIIDKDVTCYIAANTNEPATYGLNNLKYENGNHQIIIKPIDTTTVVKEISAGSDVNKSLIIISGGDSVTIDGQLNNDGEKWLKFIHHKSDQAIFQFVNDAHYDTVKYCYIVGSNRLDPRGLVYFDTTNVDTGTGNDHIVITHNFIDHLDEPALNVIYSAGTDGKENSDNEISFNEIADYKINAIIIDSIGNGNNWNIYGNTIYNSYVSDSLKSIISILEGGGHTIAKNLLGGQNKDLGGGATTNDGNRHNFAAIRLKLSNDSVARVDSNTIKRIEATYNGGNKVVSVIEVDDGKVNIRNNLIDSVYSKHNQILYGILYKGAGGISIANDTITRLIKDKYSDIEVMHIEASDADSIIQITGNKISNIQVPSTNSSSDLRGIYVVSGNANIIGNTIGGNDSQDQINFQGGGNLDAIYIYDGYFFGDIARNTITNIVAPNSSRFRALFIRNCEDNTDFNIDSNIVDNLNFSASDIAAMFYIRDGKVNIFGNKIGGNSGIVQNDTAHLYGIFASIARDYFNVDSNIIQNLDAQSHITGIYAYVTGTKSYNVFDNQITNINSSNDIDFTGITAGSENIGNVYSNTISNINLSGTNSSFTGIKITDGEQINVGKTAPNIIGSTSNSNDIQCSGAFLRGISVENASGNALAQNNIISNLTLNSTSSNAYLAGIYITGDGAKTIYANYIDSLLTSSTKTDNSDGIFALQGIYINGNANLSVDSNIIKSLNSNSSSAVDIAGIAENSETAQITKNKIFDLHNDSGGKIAGISLFKLNSGYVANNMLSLGNDDDKTYIGIWIPQDDSNTKNIYFNSVYIGGNPSGGNSYAFLRENNSTPLMLRNNIFANFRNGSGKHYAIANLNTADWDRSYADANDYYAATSSTTGLWGTDDCDFETWLSNTGENDHYLSTDAQPSFKDAASCDLHLSDYSNACAFNYVGYPINNVTQDFDGQQRSSTHPDIGADEFTPTGRSGKYVWRGWNSNNWDDSANWQCQEVPADGTSEEVVVYDMDNDPVIDRQDILNPIKISALTIYPNATFTIMPKSALTLTGDLTLNGDLIIAAQSEYDTVGSFIDNGTINGSGKLIAQKLFGKRHWHEVSSPIASATSALFTRSNPTGNFNSNFYYYDEGVDLDGDPNTEPAGDYDSQNLVAGWKAAHNGANGSDVNLQVGKGYIFWTDVYQTISFEGTPNTGDYSVSLSYTDNDPDDDNDQLPDLYDGWNFLGNPYPSYLDWDVIRQNLPSGVDDAIYVWDNDQYAGYVNGSKVMSGNLGNAIPPMQGFFVHTNADATLTLSNSDRTHGNQRYLKKAITEAEMKDYLKLKLSANGFDDLMAIRFLDDATESYDGKFDAVRMFTTRKDIPQMYALTSDKKKFPLALSALPESSLPNRTVQLGLTLGQPSTCKLSVVYLNDFKNINVWLEDKETDSLINLRLVKNYTFNFSGGDDRTRFVLHFGINHAPKFVKCDTIVATAYLPNSFDYRKLFIDSDTADRLTITPSDSLGFVKFDGQKLTILANNNQVGNYSLEITATDAAGSKTVGTIPIKIVPNHKPVSLLKSTEIYAAVGKELQFDLNSVFEDPDAGDSLKTNVEILNQTWLRYDSRNQRLIGTPHLNDTTVYVKLTATDLAQNTTEVLLKVIPQNAFEKQFVVYPNPADKMIFVYFPEKSAKVKIWSSTGQLIKQVQISSGKPITINDLAAGTYVIEVEGTRFKTKFIKK